MINCLATLTVFPVVGLALSRIAGRMQPFLAGAGLVGAVGFVAGSLHVPVFPAIVLLVTVAVVVCAVLPGVKREPAAAIGVADGIGGAAAVWLLVVATVIPLNDYDGRTFWLLKAKAIANEGVIDGPFFQGKTAANLRNQYPLLMPIDAALLMRIAGSDDDRNVRWLYALIAIAFALEVRTRFGAWPAAAVLWLPQILVGEGGALTGYSDVALGAFVGCAFFELAGRGSPMRFSLWTAFVVLTKSEGLPIAALLLLGAIVVFGKTAWRAGPSALIAGAALSYWRLRVPRTDEENFANHISQVLNRIPRLLTTLSDILRQVFEVPHWGLFWIASIAALIVLALRREWTPVVLFVFLVMPMLLLYAAAITVTDWDPAALPLSAPRLMTHFAGAAVCVLARASATLGRAAR